MSALQAIARAAHAWRDPEHPPRAEAVRKTLAAGNRFTTEALAFAINQQMGLLNVAALRRWVDGRGVTEPLRAGVLEPGNVPLAGLQDFLAVVASGHRFLGTVSRRSPALLPAFAASVAQAGGPEASFMPFDQLLPAVDILIGSGTDETVEALDRACDARGLPVGRRLLRGTRYGVAVIDGHEHADQRLRLAEDVLLHEGLGCRNVAVVFAPRDLDADPWFEAFSVFRGTFPAHPETGGSLKMTQAFLDAVGAPHAFGEGLVWLVSRGEPEVQGPGHIRWVSYDSMDEVTEWIERHAGQIQVTTARPGVLDRLPDVVDRGPLGTAQRPALDWKPDGIDTLAFLTAR